MEMKPILFNTDMVRAIQNGRKTVTRRVVKPQPPAEARIEPSPTPWVSFETDSDMWHIKPPYRPGDIMYVRETWCHQNSDEYPFVYRASVETPDAWKGQWRPSIHMPKEAARIFLRVTDVRVERLQECGKGWCLDIEKEGIVTPEDPILYINDDAFHEALREEFQKVWNSTIKPADRAIYGFAADPWVWVIEFERIKKEDI